VLLRAGKFFAVPAAGIELTDFVEGHVCNGARAVGGPFDCFIVHQYEMTAGCLAYVQFDGIDACFDGCFNRGNRVFRRAVDGAPVADRDDAVPIVHFVAGNVYVNDTALLGVDVRFSGFAGELTEDDVSGFTVMLLVNHLFNGQSGHMVFGEVRRLEPGQAGCGEGRNEQGGAYCGD